MLGLQANPQYSSTPKRLIRVYKPAEIRIVKSVQSPVKAKFEKEFMSIMN